MGHTKDEYGNGETDDFEEATDAVADFIQDVGATINEGADAVEDESELITKFRDAATESDIPEVLDEQGQYVRWDVHPDSLVGEMRGYTLEEAEDEFRDKEFKTHVIASYQEASHTSVYDKSDASMRRITDEEDTNDAGASDWQLHVRLFDWYDPNFNDQCVDVYTHYEPTIIHPIDHYNGDYWHTNRAKKMVKHLMPQWDYNYDEFENYNEEVEAFCSDKEGNPYE